MKICYYDRDYKTNQHSLKLGEATLMSSGAVRIKLSDGTALERAAGEWLSERMMNQDIKRCLYEAVKAEIEKELKEERKRNETL